VPPQELEGNWDKCGKGCANQGHRATELTAKNNYFFKKKKERKVEIDVYSQIQLLNL